MALANIRRNPNEHSNVMLLDSDPSLAVLDACCAGAAACGIRIFTPVYLGLYTEGATDAANIAGALAKLNVASSHGLWTGLHLRTDWVTAQPAKLAVLREVITRAKPQHIYFDALEAIAGGEAAWVAAEHAIIDGCPQIEVRESSASSASEISGQLVSRGGSLDMSWLDDEPFPWLEDYRAIEVETLARIGLGLYGTFGWAEAKRESAAGPATLYPAALVDAFHRGVKLGVPVTWRVSAATLAEPTVAATFPTIALLEEGRLRAAAYLSRAILNGQS